MTENESGAAQFLAEALLEETLRGFEGIKAAAQQSLQIALDQAKKNMNHVLIDFDNMCEETRKSTEKDIRKEIKAFRKQHIKLLKQIDKESVHIIRETWAMSKTNLQMMLENAKTTLGPRSKNLEKTLKDVTKFMDRLIDDLTRSIHEYCKTMEAQLKECSDKYS